MGQPNLRIATAEESPRRTPEREALAEAVERHAEIVRRLAAIEAAQQTARSEHYAASAAADAAPAAIERAKGDVARHLTDVAMGTAGPAPKSVQHFRAKAQEAQDARDAAQSARDALAEQHRAEADSLVVARLNLDSRIKAVIAAEAPVEKLVANYRAAHREFATRQRVLEWLEGRGAIPRDVFWRRDRGDLLDGAAPWEAAVTALATDPDAPLPTS